MTNYFFSLLIILCFTQRTFAQQVTLNTIKGTYYVTQLEKRKMLFSGREIKHNRRFVIPVDAVLNFTDSSGETIIVNDSAIFSSRVGFNKPYSNLKPITLKYNKYLVYNNQSLISQKNFIALLNNINRPEIMSMLKIHKRNRKIRNAFCITSGVLCLVGFEGLLIGLSNSSGRNSYPQEQRSQAAFQTNLGLGIMSAGAAFSLSALIVTIQNQRILKKDMVKLYNQQR